MNDNLKYWLKKISPYAVLLVVAVLLMIYFKQNKSLEKYMIEGKAGLINYYTENLKPLFFRTEITNEDVFNFALHKNLPVDKKKNDLLQIESDDLEGNSFELKPGVWKSGTNNFEKYVKYLELNEKEITSLDSILNLYKDDLYVSVLFNDSNTVAVSPNIYHLQKAAYADIFNFTESVQQNVDLENERESNYDKIVDVAENLYPDEYIVFAKDTVFESKCFYDKEKIKEQLLESKGNLEKVKFAIKNKNWVNKIVPDNFSDTDVENEKLVYEIESDWKKVFVPQVFTSSIKIPEFGSLKFAIGHHSTEKGSEGAEDSVISNIAISFSDDENVFGGTSFNFDFNIADIEKIAAQSIEYIGEEDFEGWAEFGLKIDSLANSFSFQFNDSLGNFDYSKFKMELKEFKKEMKKEKENLKQELGSTKKE